MHRSSRSFAVVVALALLAGCKMCQSPWDYCNAVPGPNGCPNCDFGARRGSIYAPMDSSEDGRLAHDPTTHARGLGTDVVPSSSVPTCDMAPQGDVAPAGYAMPDDPVAEPDEGFDVP